MPKYIEADEYKKKLRKRQKAGTISRNVLIIEFRAINEMPSADVRENVHGEWQIGMEYGAEIYTCSKCGLESADDSNFCPNCGADMRGDTE